MRPATLYSVFGRRKGLNEFIQCFSMDYVYKETLDLDRAQFWPVPKKHSSKQFPDTVQESAGMSKRRLPIGSLDAKHFAITAAKNSP
ncbi:hypothetical protein DUI87_10551 [Hirundo rustica rustica]|uniref:Uncharacterized protein n=1 Tax=Hirundo rustica rustica TaxID=333673 RepID=A0A3M0KK55_HIRRU|nr:hypothetical protein DUI87_10551 [Hirundo rustica rustica]